MSQPPGGSPKTRTTPCCRCAGPTVPAEIPGSGTTAQAHVCYRCNHVTWEMLHPDPTDQPRAEAR